ncbi:MAG: hypothetical protein F7C38_05985 [Desulfurococcales archaeon]|nr:hypothetical protein [Desulfurococcales archaeon]
MECVRETLKLTPRDQIRIEYGLRLEPGNRTNIPGAKPINPSHISLQERGEGPYNLAIILDEKIEPGNYYIVLNAWVKITGGAEVKSGTEYVVLLDVAG